MGEVNHKYETVGVPDNYWLLNFNDFEHAFVTLFCLMVVNNWMVIAEMHKDVLGSSTVPLLFFGLFYVFSVLISLNIIIAVILDMY